MALKDDVRLGFIRLTQLIKENKGGGSPGLYSLEDVIKNNLTANENSLYSITDKAWTKNEKLTIQYAFQAILGPYLSGPTSAPTITVRIKKGSQIIFQSQANGLQWNNSYGFVGESVLYTRDLLNAMVSSVYFSTRAVGGYTAQSTTSQSGCLEQSISVKDASPITFVIFVSSPTTQLQIILQNFEVKRETLSPV